MKKANKEKWEQRTIPCSYLLLILIVNIFCIIPAQPVLASPITFIPLDSWVYPTISRLETLQAFAEMIL